MICFGGSFLLHFGNLKPSSSQKISTIFWHHRIFQVHNLSTFDIQKPFVLYRVNLVKIALAESPFSPLTSIILSFLLLNAAFMLTACSASCVQGTQILSSFSSIASTWQRQSSSLKGFRVYSTTYCRISDNLADGIVIVFPSPQNGNEQARGISNTSPLNAGFF